MGLDAHRAVEAALALLAHERPVVLLGPRHCDQLALARAIHAASSRRAHAFVAVERPTPNLDALLAKAHGGTVYLDLDAAPISELDPHFLIGLLGWGDSDVRPILTATARLQVKRLAGVLATAPMLEMRALHDRPRDILRLLDALLAQTGTEHRAAELVPDRLQALVAARWPQNLESLRLAVPKIAAYLETGGIREAARSLGLSHTTVLEALRPPAWHAK